MALKFLNRVTTLKGRFRATNRDIVLLNGTDPDQQLRSLNVVYIDRGHSYNAGAKTTTEALGVSALMRGTSFTIQGSYKEPCFLFDNLGYNSLIFFFINSGYSITI